MILKTADGRQADLEELRRLLAGVSGPDRVRVEREIRTISSGVTGERNAAHFLDREFGHNTNLAVLHDLRLTLDGEVAQIDHLVIHRVQQAAWVLETKNFSGRLSCDEHGDWTRWLGRRPVSIPSPNNQARRQVILLRRWLDAHGIEMIRKIVPVVLIAPTSSIDRRHLGPDDHVVKSDNFARWWEKQTDDISIIGIMGLVGRHLANGMSASDFKELGAKLCAAHTPLTRDWRKSLGLSPAEAPSEVEDSDGLPALPLVIESRLGNVSITRLPDGRIALRNDPKEDLIEVVKATCKGKARWNPRFRNWVFDEAGLVTVITELKQRLAL